MPPYGSARGRSREARCREHSVRFPDTRSGAQARVIGRAAVDMPLRQTLTGSGFFFPSGWGEGHFAGVVRVPFRLCAMAGAEDVLPHTLRHTFASAAGDLRFSELTVQRCSATPPAA